VFSVQSDLGNSLVNLSRIVPDGLLVFFPSYAVLANSVAAWKIPPTRGAPSILDAIQKKKAVRRTQTHVDDARPRIRLSLRLVAPRLCVCVAVAAPADASG
jgi:hypothetical protein